MIYYHFVVYKKKLYIVIKIGPLKEIAPLNLLYIVNLDEIKKSPVDLQFYYHHPTALTEINAIYNVRGLQFVS